jgi:hypothetical protein
MSSGTAIRLLVLAGAIIAAWTIAYRLGRPSAPAAHIGYIGKTPDRAVVHDAWKDLVRRGPAASPPVLANVESRARAPLPLGPFGANIDELKRRADGGDAAAALALAKGYQRCQFYQPANDRAALEKRVEDSTVNQLNLIDQLEDWAKQRAKQSGVDPGKFPKVEAKPVYDAQLQAETELGESCGGVDLAEARKWAGWFVRAAELGDAEARIDYWDVAFKAASTIPIGDVQRQKVAAVEYLDSELQRGDWRALAAIGTIFEVGYLTEPDPFFAHAYYFAAAQAPVADISALPWIGKGLTRLFTSNDTQTYLARSMALTAQQLDPQQIAESERIGAALYGQCCGGGR